MGSDNNWCIESCLVDGIENVVYSATEQHVCFHDRILDRRLAQQNELTYHVVLFSTD
jgi:hypothetical protein